MQLFVKNWQKGLVTKIEKESVVRGGASSCLNWHFLGDRIELRRGTELLGTENLGIGGVNFVAVARKYDGTQVPFWGHGQKALYYDADTADSIEMGSNAIPTSEDISYTPYQSLAGSFLLLSSPNTGVYKIVVANRAIVDQQQDTFRGYIKALLGRLALWNRKDKFGGADKTGLELSAIDRDSLADYDFTSAEDVGTGDGATSAFSGTLAFKTANAKKTCHFVRIAGASGTLTTITAITAAAAGVVTAAGHGLAVGDVVVFQDIVGMVQLNKRIAVITAVSGNDVTIDIDTTGFTAYSSGGKIAEAELFTDDRNGGLTGSLGGTGTINYATGAWTATFAAAVTNLGEVVADYYSEDMTSQGILDFDQGDGSTIADSLSFRQDDAGFFQNIGVIGSTLYCLHSIKTYALRLISSSDITNLIYRDKVGIPYFRAKVDTGDGTYYLDATDPKNPQVRLLEISAYSSEVLPRSVSTQLDLSTYEFDKAVMFEWLEYVCLACRTEDSTVNNRLFLFNRIWKTWEIHSIRIADMAAWNGALLIGDSASNNLFKFFSGLSDEGAIIENEFITGNDFLDKEGVKDCRRMKVAGLIGDEQQIDVSYSLDNDDFVLAKSVLGTGSYVDASGRKQVGNTTLGEEVVGGGAAQEDAIFASPYEIEFNVGTARFQRIRIKFEAKAIGYASISELGFVDVREKGKRLPTKYVAT